MLETTRWASGDTFEALKTPGGKKRRKRVARRKVLRSGQGGSEREQQRDQEKAREEERERRERKKIRVRERRQSVPSNEEFEGKGTRRRRKIGPRVQ